MSGAFAHSFRHLGNLGGTASIAFEASKQSVVKLAEKTYDHLKRSEEKKNEQTKRLFAVTGASALDLSAFDGASSAAAAAWEPSASQQMQFGVSSALSDLPANWGGGDASFLDLPMGAGLGTSTGAARNDPPMSEFETDLASLFELGSIDPLSSRAPPTPTTPSAAAALHTRQSPASAPSARGGGGSGSMLTAADDSTSSLTAILDSLLADTTLDHMNTDTHTTFEAVVPSPVKDEPRSHQHQHLAGGLAGVLPLPALPSPANGAAAIDFASLVPAASFGGGSSSGTHAAAAACWPAHTAGDKAGLFSTARSSAASTDTDSISSGSPPGSPRCASPSSLQHFETPDGETHSAPSSPDAMAVEMDAASLDALEKPKLSYAQLSAMALWSMSRTGRQGKVEDIYKWISDNHPYYRTSKTKYWKNSIRHTLSTNRHFNAIKPAETADPLAAKVDKPARSQNDTILWELSADAYTHMDKLEPGSPPTCLADRRRCGGVGGRKRSRMRKRSMPGSAAPPVAAATAQAALPSSAANKRHKAR